MHVALRPYAEPPRGFGRYFAIGVFAGSIIVSVVVSQITASERAQAEAAMHERNIRGNSDDVSSR